MSGAAWVGDAQSGRGRIVDVPTVSAHDLGVAQGIGLFETMRVRPGPRVPLWGRHVARLAASARAFGLGGFDACALHAAALTLLRDVPDADRVLRLMLTAGARAPTAVIACRPFAPRQEPLTLALVAAGRDRHDPTVAHKTTSRAFWHLAQHEAVRRGADEALVCADRGRIAESTTGNLFVQLDGQLVTPPADGRILPGIARAVLLEGLAAAGSPAVERAVTPAELDAAQGLIVSNAVHGPRVARLVPAGRVGGLGPLAELWNRALDGPRLRSGAPECR